jgi:hypothetical protein
VRIEAKDGDIVLAAQPGSADDSEPEETEAALPL